MIIKATLTFILFTFSMNCFCQAFDLKLLTKLLDVDLKEAGLMINKNQWLEDQNVKAEENPLKFRQWRSIDSSTKLQKKTMIKITDFSTRAPKMLTVVTREPVLINDIDVVFKNLKFPAKKTEKAIGAIHKFYYYGKHILIFSKFNDSVIVSIGDLKTYLSGLELRKNNPDVIITTKGS